MLNFFTSRDWKARARATQWLGLAETVWNFRRDRLAPSDAADLTLRRAELRRLVNEKAGAGQLTPAIAALDAVLRKTGGAIHPRSAWTENVEFALVAAIMILGFRTYFLQPMVIPTNSMWPTYYGMTAENFPPPATAPAPWLRLIRLAAFGAVRKEADAPEAGEVSAEFALDASGHPLLIPTVVTGTSWWVFPAKFAEYTFFVNDQPVKIRLPEDFHDFESVFLDTYFPDRRALAEQWQQAQAEGRVKERLVSLNATQRYRLYRVPLGRAVKAGDPLIRFDLLKGDMLFVDRFSYNFVRPAVGSAFVFETEAIPLFPPGDGGPDQFLIKRLAGGPGDTLEIKEPALYRNGSPIEGAAAFDRNARREGDYRGYFNAPENGGRYLSRGETVTVPPHSFMGLGDNSTISEDGRYWGFVPEKDVIGRPLFLYYPFTRRWGFAK